MYFDFFFIPLFYKCNWQFIIIIVLDKASHLIPDLIYFVPLYIYVQPHLCNWYSFYQQWQESLNFLIILML